MDKAKCKKRLLLGLRILITALAWTAAIVVLYIFEFFLAFGAVDNIAGAVPIALAIVGAGSISALAFMRHSKRFIPLTATLGVFVILAFALFPTALTGNWWIRSQSIEGGEARPDLSMFVPFEEGNQLAVLEKEPLLQLTGNLPRLDGATALFPVFSAFAQAVFNEDYMENDTVKVTTTIEAYSALIAGERCIVFAAGASASQKQAARAAGAELIFTPIGREAFVFLVGKNNPITNITMQQIRNIYSGKTAHWSTLGWREGGRIIAFQRPDGSGSQTGLQELMRGLPMQVPQPLPCNSLIGEGSLMQQVSVEWGGVQPALGFSYRFFATTMFNNPHARMLSVNGVYPSVENIRNGMYPIQGNFYAVTNGEPTGNTRLLIDWILSEQGQRLIELTGYVPLY